ncbi:hypothetical protein BJ973_000978 [Actinoplanes tereljensis]|uniref:Uncharacterized protein n=1 Tax=Paractinoplanes tereljensis TaxID=571912 RepID=A0A919NZ76_9ACTN|nr:GTPase-associated protein 1-related protein [Actinoplanes tereljensis]GIF26534.1 hypothetical protein Ate02nite_92640 [Actinoplanes tereljensis]
MAFGQLYYTSCVTGLAGAPGFQFAAVSDGLGPDVLDRVESLTAYQAPRAVTVAGAAGLPDAPVNLCFSPGTDTVIARVAYVGTDYSGRPGNYFAHALVTRDPTADLGGVLPIELWDAPCWVDTPGGGTRLPDLPGPPAPGPLNRAAVGEFLHDPVRAALLPALLTAADDAVHRGSRRVVLIAETSTEVAAWIAALGYLLPPDTTGLLSFATYEHDPQYGRTHVAGTLPGGGSRLDGVAGTLHLFDLTTGRATDVVVHPLARILAQLEVSDAAPAWQRAIRLSAGDERTFDDWLPVVAAALTTWPSGPERARDQPAEVAAWLAVHAARLGRADVEELGTATLVQLTVGPIVADRRTADALAGLARAAEAAGVPDLLAQIEIRTVDVVVASPAPVLPEMVLRTDDGRRHAAITLSGHLAAVPATTALLLLDWAVTAGIPIEDADVRQAGELTIGPGLLLGSTGPAAHRSFADRPALRAGVVRYLGAVGLEELDRMAAAFQGGLADVLGPELEQAGPAVRQALAVARVRAGTLDPAAGLGAVLDAAGREPPDERVLDLLFPDRRWTAAEALRVLDALGERRVTTPPVVRRLSETVAAEPAPAAWPEHTELCSRLARSAALPLLAEPARRRVEVFRAADDWVDQLRRAGKDRAGLLVALRQWFGELGPDDQRRVEAVLMGRIDKLKATDRGDLIRTLPGLRRAYCRMTVAELGDRNVELGRVTAAMRTLRHLDRPEPSRATGAAATELDTALRRAVGGRSRRWQARLIEHAEHESAPETAAFIRRWYKHAPPTMLDRLFRRRGTPDGMPIDASTERKAF